MATFRQAQTGNRVYRGVGQSPNMGQVSAKGAQGYLKRELRNRNQGGVVRPVGNDGKSDSRSGVAARALRGNIANNGGRPKASAPPQRGTKSLIPQQTPPSSGTVGPAPVAPVVPQIRVNDKGMLELPYSQNMSLDALDALGESNEDLLALQQEEQRVAMEAMQGRRDADLAYAQLQKQNLSSNAASGTAYSSQYGKAVSDSATAYSNTLADITRQESDFQSQASMRRASIQNALAQQLAAAAQQNAIELGEDAGSLGYGNYEGDTHTHDDNSQAYGNKGGKKNPPKKNPPKKNDPPKRNDPPKGGSGGGPVKGKGKR